MTERTALTHRADVLIANNKNGSSLFIHSFKCMKNVSVALIGNFYLKSSIFYVCIIVLQFLLQLHLFRPKATDIVLVIAFGLFYGRLLEYFNRMAFSSVFLEWRIMELDDCLEIVTLGMGVLLYRRSCIVGDIICLPFLLHLLAL